MKRKALSLFLVLAMLLSILPVFHLSAQAAAASSDMDALSALGIDSGIAPEGYDATSLDNPYGKNTVELAPVSELYTVGLQNKLTYPETYDTTNTELQSGGSKELHPSTAANVLQSTLYGNAAWGQTTVSGIMGSGATSTVKSGTTAATGDYTLITNGTVNSGDASFPTKGYLKDAANASTDLHDDFKFALSSVAAGNFDGNESGLSAQTAMVYTSEYSKNGGLYLRFGSAVGGTYGDYAKTLLDTSKNIGNPSLSYEDRLVEDFAQNPYQLQNYLQVATGDWNNDGLDEVAVYIPEQGNSRIVVYALQLNASDPNKATAYIDPSKWKVVWTYSLKEGAVVSNMVSLVSGDVNLDGTDDLAATWGYYYGPEQNIGSTAVVMFGAKGTELLKKSQQFSLTYGVSNIVRASFEFGDMAGSDSDVLILCGQSDADLKAGNTQTRYVALYDWNGTSFVSNVNQNFNLFEKDKDNNYTWPIMKGRGDKYYSLPLCTANTALISQGLGGGSDLLYFDSLIIKYGDKGLEIKEAWDNQSAMQQNTDSLVDYAEYGAVAGDFTGQTGAGALVTMTQTLSAIEQNTAYYTVTGEHKEPTPVWGSYYKNWLYKLFKIETRYIKSIEWRTVIDKSTVNAPYEQLTMGKAYMVTVDPAVDYIKRSETDYSASICLANTDNDSSYMNYSGKHYYTYTDPQVLAVLASPPYFSDLLNRDDLSGNYGESTTTYSKSKGSGSGTNVSSTITLGAYVSFEHDFEVFGVKVASVEAEAQITSNFTFDWEQESTLEQTITYSAAAGEDMVSFYSIPMEIYEYSSYVPDGKGGYGKVLTTVNIPHEAAVRLLSLEEYESIQKDYNVLPPIADNVLTHTVGDPATYPTSSAGYKLVAEYTGDPASVGFSGTGGGSAISQEIAMSESKSTAFSASVAVEAKAGGGAGDFKVGVIAGAEVGAGSVKISTSGSSFSGEMQNMPIEAQTFGYRMNWRIFCYKYSDGGRSFPVVNYIVSEPSSPPPLPDDFTQDMAKTTSDSITLTWSYDKTVAGFRIYRYYEFPEGSGSYEVKFVPFSAAVRFDNLSKTYYFNYKDENLSPYTEYKYQIKTVRADNPKESIYSEPMSCRTKTSVGYPSITLDGLVDGKLPIYPDDNGVVSLSIANAASYTGIGYQWQKLIDGAWTDISGRTDKALTIANAGTADKGTYRCRVNCIYYDEGAAQNYYISAYSKEFLTVYEKRTPKASIFKAEEKFTPVPGGNPLDGLLANIELHSANKDHAAAPTGNVTFTVKGTDYEYSETVPLDDSSDTKSLDGMERKYSTASLEIASLPEGVYSVTAYYGGSRVFKDMETTKKVLVVIGKGSADRLDLAATNTGNSITKFVYGEAIHPSLFTITREADGKTTETLVNASYKYYSNNPADWIDHDTNPATDKVPNRIDFTAGSPTPDVGSYTMEAYTGGDLEATQSFTVGQKPITVSVKNQTNVDAGTVSTHLPVISCTQLTSEALAALNLTYTTTNSAGNVITLDNSTEPGNYTVTACTGETTPINLYNNYNVTYVSGAYTIIGATYRLTAVAAPYTDKAGTRPVGTVGISNKTQTFADYAAKTSVMLYAVPEAGYEVDTWTATFNNNTSKTQQGGNTYTLTTEAQECIVTVTFKPATITLSTVAQPAAGGTLSCSDKNFTSPAYVSTGAEYSFTAAPKAGYHFNKWQTVAGGTTDSPAGTANADGSNTLSVSIGTASMTVYAYFTRDAYTLTLDGDISASYMFDDDGNSTTPLVKTAIPSGASIAGDTEVTLTPKIGYQAAVGAKFKLNGTETTDSVSHVFTITQNTTVSLDTVRNNYAVTVSAVNGSVVSKVNGVTTSAQALAAVEGGSALTFTAHANRGYVFDHWMLNDVAVPNSTETLTIAELGATTAVAAVFKANTPYPATAVVNTAARGTMKYTLYDIYGDLVGTALTDMPVGTPLTVYKGEKLVLTVAVTSGNMIEQWEVNGTNSYTSQKTYTVENIGAAINAKAYLKAASSYAVNFLVMDANGTLTAKADDLAFNTGTLQYGGSSLAFSATPASGYMLDYWTVTVGGASATENTAPVKDALGNTVIDPIYVIEPLTKNLTVRARFTALVTNSVALPSTTTMGVSAITYITPIGPTDDGTRNVTTAAVRTGGKVVMTFTPNVGYGASASALEQLVKSADPGATVTAAEKTGGYTVTVSNLTTDLDLSTADIFYAVHNVVIGTMTNGAVTAAPTAAKEGETVTLTVAPNAGYTLTSLALDPSSVVLSPAVTSNTLIYTFTMPNSEVTVSASFEAIPVPPANGGGGGAVPPEPQTIPAGGNGTTMEVNVTVSDSIAKLDMDQTALQTLSAYSGTVSFDFTSLKDVTSASIPADVFGVLTGAEKISGLSIALPNANLTFDQAALAAIGAAGSSDVTLKADTVDAKTLTDEQKNLVGDRPVLDLTLTVGDKQISDFGTGTAQVNVPYTLRSGENPEAVVVWYLNDKNILEAVTGQYDAATGTVHFQTDHFSKYVIGQLPFRDVGRDAWYFNNVSFAFANGLFSGTSETEFAPETSMTRSMLVTVLWRMEGEPTAKKASKFRDVTSGQWYEKAVDWAAEHGIVSGYGDGFFGSDDPITREQMAVILMSYAKLKGYDVSAAADLKKFTDSKSISAWAKAAMQWANAGSLISGIGASTLAPQGAATRAQVAAILMRFVENIAQ